MHQQSQTISKASPMAESFGINQTGKPSAWDATTARRDESKTPVLDVLMSAKHQKELEKMLLDSSPFHNRMMERDHDRIFGMPIHIVEGLPGDGIYLLDTSKLPGIIMDPMRMEIDTTRFGSSFKTSIAFHTTTERRKSVNETMSMKTVRDIERDFEKLAELKHRTDGLRRLKDKTPLEVNIVIDYGFQKIKVPPASTINHNACIDAELAKVEQELKLLKAELICEVAKLE